MSKRAQELTRQFEEAVADFAATVEAVSPAEWAVAICNDEGWTVAQVAQHVSGQFPIEMEFVTAGAEGRPLPAYTWDDVNEKNEGRAARNAGVSKGDVLRELRENAASVSAYLSKLTDEQLDRTGVLGLADGAEVTTQQLIEGGILIAHVRGHLESIRTCQIPSGAGI